MYEQPADGLLMWTIAPSQAALQLELTEQEGDDDATIGTAAWIAEGLKLEEIQFRVSSS